MTEPLVPKYTVFSGDQCFNQEVYDDVIHGRYANLGHQVIAAANEYVYVDDETAERWLRLSVAAGRLDNFLDDVNHQEAYQLYKQGVAYFSGRGDMPEAPPRADGLLEPTLMLLHNATAELPDKKRERLLKAADLIGDISVAKADCTKVREYCDMVEWEGWLSGFLVIQSSSEVVEKQKGFKAFSRWALAVGVVGNLADSARDLSTDHLSGLTKVKASSVNQRFIATKAITHGSKLLTPKALQTSWRSLRAKPKLNYETT